MMKAEVNYRNPSNRNPEKLMGDKVRRCSLLGLSDAEKALRFDAIVKATFSHVDDRDLLNQLHPRRTLDIKRRVDAVETWFEGDWLSNVMRARDGRP